MLAPGSTPISHDFIKPCLPCVTLLPPSGEEWLHEIKHPGHRLIARRDGDGIRLFAERGEDWTGFFPLIVEAVGLIPARSCIVDGELVRCDDHGKPTMGPLREGASEKGAAFYAFDLIEVNGFDLRRDPIEDRKRVLAHLLRRPPDGIRLNPQFEKGGENLLWQVSRLGFEGVLSKRRGSRYLSGRCPDWLLSRKLD
jgi:bifunctional non-homologous end joining protein LigD